MRNFFKNHGIRLFICFIYGIIILCIYNLVNSNWKGVLEYCNAFFIGGFSLLCFGCLSLINRLGGFEIFSHMLAKRGPNGSKEDLYTYSLRKKEERSRKGRVYLSYFIVGGIYLLISMILMIWL